MKKQNFAENTYLIAIILVLFTLISRVLILEKYFFGYDSVNYAFGVIDFSLHATRPHLPGSILFVKSIELLNIIFGNIHQSFLILLNIFSSIATLLSYLIFLKYFETKKAILLTLFLIFNPLLWFYGAVTEIYVFDWFFASLILFVSFRKNSIYILPLIFAFFSGFRPSSGVLLLPFYFYLFWNQKVINWGKLVGYFCLAIIIFFAWFFPLIYSAGGIHEYIALFSTNNPMESISLAKNIFRLSSIMLYFLVPFLMILIFHKRTNYQQNKTEIIKILFMILPPVLFFIFLHYSKGYALLIVTPLVLLLGIFIKKKYTLVIIFATIFEIILFLFLPTSETSLESKLKPSIRKSGITQIWLDRTFSDYSLTLSEINLRDESINNLISAINSSEVNRIFLGPTLSHFGRALQNYFPQKEILSINFKNYKSFVQFKNMEVNQISIDKIDKNNILIVRKDFYNSYLQNFDMVFSDSNLIILVQNKELLSTFEHVIDSLFVR